MDGMGSTPGKFSTTQKALAILAILLLSTISLFLFQRKGFPSFDKKVLEEVKIFGVKEGAEYAPGELIVKLKEGYDPDKKRLELAGIASFERLYKSNTPIFRTYYLLKLKGGVSVMQAQENLRKLEEIEDIDANYILALDKSPNDPLFAKNQWYLPEIRAIDAWDITTGSSDVVVAVLDSGIDDSHEDLPAAGEALPAAGEALPATGEALPKSRMRVFPKSEYEKYGLFDVKDTLGHGTFVAGLIGAATDNRTGMAGINWGVTLLPVNVTGSEKKFSFVSVVRAIEYSVEKGAKVINLSLGSTRTEKACSEIPSLQKLIDEVTKKGVVIVASSGNKNTDISKTIPASCTNVITVAAFEKPDSWGTSGVRADFSSYGEGVALAAPGRDILSAKASLCSFCANTTSVEGKYITFSGTSAAAPQVTGAVALLLSANPNLTPARVRQCLVENADDFDPKPDKPIGKKLNLYRALKACSHVAGGASPSAVSYPKSASISLLSCVKPAEKIKVSIRAEAENADNPIIAVSAHFRKQGLPGNGKDKTGESWLQIFKDLSAGDKMTYEKSAEWTVPKEEGNYDAVVNVLTHKPLGRGGGPFAEKGCSGNPFAEERNFTNMQDCGEDARKVLKVSPNCGQEAALQSTEGRVQTYDCEFKLQKRGTDNLQLSYLDCSPN